MDNNRVIISSRLSSGAYGDVLKGVLNGKEEVAVKKMKNDSTNNSYLKLILKRELLSYKKSQAHVEMILATTLFIGFLVFLFVFLRSSSKITEEIPIDEEKYSIIKEMEK